MKKIATFITYLIISIVSIYVILNILFKQNSNRMSSANNANRKIIVIDSIQVHNQYIYWYCYDLGSRGYSIGKLSYVNNRKQINEDNTFFVSSYITDLEFHNLSSQLTIKLFQGDYSTSTDTQILKEVPDFKINFKNNGDYLKSIEYRLKEKNNLK